jgi:SAM-dependent methyltransferase
VVYEHPLAYVLGLEGLGLEGLGLLRSFTGEFDRDFVAARIAEIRRLLDDESLADAAVEVDRVDTVAGYRAWSRTYDEPRNTVFDIDEPVVKEIIDALPVGSALDAACGTGRYAEFLAARGHQVIGADSSPDMLARARTRVPDGEFRTGDLHQLPVADATVDLVVCALALTHVPALDPVIAEFARVLRPGGHVVIADMHPESVARGYIPLLRDRDGQPGRVASYRHLVGDYLRAALSAGLLLRRCEEPRVPREPRTASSELGPWEIWPWVLEDLIPEAAHAANDGVPSLVIWHFQLPH